MKFRIDGDGNRSKYEDINGNLYKITLDNEKTLDVPRQKVSSSVTYWIRKRKQGKNPIFKYGKVDKVDSIPDIFTNHCNHCDITYKSRSAFLVHMNTHIKAVHNEYSNPRTTEAPITNNITNNNNSHNTINNTINISLRPFGEENPKWLTAELLFEALQNLNGAIPRLLQEKHFNDSFPENKNIQISDIRHMNKRLRVYEKTGWRIRNREKVLRSAMDKAYDLLYDAVHNDGDDTDEVEEGTEEEGLSRKEIRRLHNSRRARRTIERALQVFDEFRPYTTPTAENINDEVDTMLLDHRERERDTDALTE